MNVEYIGDRHGSVNMHYIQRSESVTLDLVHLVTSLVYLKFF